MWAFEQLGSQVRCLQFDEGLMLETSASCMIIGFMEGD